MEELEVNKALARSLSRLSYTIRIREYTALSSITPTQRQLMNIFVEQDRVLTMTEVAHEMGITVATVSDCISALEKRGFITSGVDKKDRRARALKLTQEGLDSLGENEGMLQAGIAQLQLEEKEYLLHMVARMETALYKAQVTPKIRGTEVGEKVAPPVPLPDKPAPAPLAPDDVHMRLRRAKAINKPSVLLDWLLARCATPECEECAVIICPHHDASHFKGACPSCIKAIKSATTTSTPLPRHAIA